MMTELKNCPFCGKQPILVEYKAESLWNHDIVDWANIECRECDYHISRRDNLQELIELWNTRL